MRSKDVVYGDPTGDKVTCVGVYTVVLGRDGARACLRGTARACRHLLRRSADR